MCNIAGYVGDRPAAPILIEMIRRQEGLWGGYYTGLATIHEGKIYYAKLMGDLDHLLENTDAASLPGSIGIIHSRSRSGGGDEWSHPFIGSHAGEAKIAYVAQGAAGFFASLRDEQNAIADRLLADGYDMQSRIVIDGNHYQRLSDGTTAHMSDVMCQLILSHMDSGKTEADAMSGAFCEMPGEIVGLLLSLARPQEITYSSVNQSMFVGFAPHGAYLATSTLGFPEDAGAPRLLPNNASCYVSRGGYTVMPYAAPPASIAPMDGETVSKIYATITAAMRERALTMREMYDMTGELYGRGDCKPRGPILYTLLDGLNRRGELIIEHRRVPGAAAGLQAPQFAMRLR